MRNNRLVKEVMFNDGRRIEERRTVQRMVE